MKKNYVPHILLLGYLVEFTMLGIDPYDRAVWWAENIPIVLIVLSVVLLYTKNIRFSNLAYWCMAFLVYWHTVGGHYTFELVPFDVVNSFLGTTRNMFDRIGHFSVGFYAIPIAEYLVRYKKVSIGLAIMFGIAVIGTVAATYEIIEWGYAVLYGGSAGAAFLGSQGDIWDAQKDMALDILGAICISIIFYCRDFFSKKK